MLRQLQSISGKNVDASYKAASAAVRGRLVQKKYANKTFDLAASQEGLYFLDKEQIPTGVDVIFNNLSDYHAGFENVVVDEFAVLVAPLKGEVYATSEYVETSLAVGDYLEVAISGGDKGKLKKAASGTSIFKYVGTVNDNGHTLAVVEIV